MPFENEQKRCQWESERARERRREKRTEQSIQRAISMHALIIISSWKISTGNNRRNVRALNGRGFCLSCVNVRPHFQPFIRRNKKLFHFYCGVRSCDFVSLIRFISLPFHCRILIAIWNCTQKIGLPSCFEHCFFFSWLNSWKWKRIQNQYLKWKYQLNWTEECVECSMQKCFLSLAIWWLWM